VSEKKEELEVENEEKGNITEEELDKLVKERDEYKEKYLLKLAEMDNYRKMLERDMAREIERCKADIVKEFIEPYENLQRALSAIKEEREGIELVLKQMEKTLKSLGLVAIHAKGEKFDPMLHEAIGVVEGDEDDIVVEEYQKGYTLNGMVLRHAKVLVSKKKEVKENE